MNKIFDKSFIEAAIDHRKKCNNKLEYLILRNEYLNSQLDIHSKDNDLHMLIGCLVANQELLRLHITTDGLS